MNKSFSIEVPKLSLGKHRFQFFADRRFFADFADALFTDGAVNIEVEVDKTNTMIDARFHLKGSIELACDRCLEPFSHFFETDERIVYSYDEDMREADSEEVIYISRNIYLLDLSQELYDFISLQVPLRKVASPESGHQCPAEVLQMLADGEAYEAAREAAEAEQTNEVENIDPRWESLKKFKS